MSKTFKMHPVFATITVILPLVADILICLLLLSLSLLTYFQFPFHFFLFSPLVTIMEIISVIMVSSSRIFSGTENCVCNCFLLAFDKDSLSLCCACCERV